LPTSAASLPPIHRPAQVDERRGGSDDHDGALFGDRGVEELLGQFGSDVAIQILPAQ
jgi:hypothetical protein